MIGGLNTPSPKRKHEPMHSTYEGWETGWLPEAPSRMWCHTKNEEGGMSMKLPGGLFIFISLSMILFLPNSALSCSLQPDGTCGGTGCKEGQECVKSADGNSCVCVSSVDLEKNEKVRLQERTDMEVVRIRVSGGPGSYSKTTTFAGKIVKVFPDIQGGKSSCSITRWRYEIVNEHLIVTCGLSGWEGCSAAVWRDYIVYFMPTADSPSGRGCSVECWDEDHRLSGRGFDLDSCDPAFDSAIQHSRATDSGPSYCSCSCD